jgi:hypothetical protein
LLVVRADVVCSSALLGAAAAVAST